MMKKYVFTVLVIFLNWTSLHGMEVNPTEPDEAVLFVNHGGVQIYLDKMLRDQPDKTASGSDAEKAAQIISFLAQFETKEFLWMPALRWGEKEAGGHYIHVKKNASSPSYSGLQERLMNAKGIQWITNRDAIDYFTFLKKEESRRKSTNKRVGFGCSGVTALAALLLFALL
jgi:hypothetical protein